jgi:hypothetical protein
VSYDALCQKIKDESPYGVGSVICNVGAAEFDGLDPALFAPDENGVMTLETADLTEDNLQDCNWYAFNDKTLRHPKVMKVPLTFRRGNDTIKAHILICYGGPGV